MMSLCCKKYVPLLTVCLCTSVFFLGLFHFDNKYQYPGSQAANGILALSGHQKTHCVFWCPDGPIIPMPFLRPMRLQTATTIPPTRLLVNTHSFPALPAPRPMDVAPIK